jgi:hypothetical protein
MFDRHACSVRVTRDVRAVALRRGDEWPWLWVATHRDFDRRFPARSVYQAAPQATI